MSDSTLISARLREVLNSPAGGIVALADELLALAGGHRVSLTRQSQAYRVSLASGDEITWSAPKSVVRAILARFAALCNERRPNSVSPYGGEGEILLNAAPPKAIRVKFVNTPEVQSAELDCVEDVRRDGILLDPSNGVKAVEDFSGGDLQV